VRSRERERRRARFIRAVTGIEPSCCDALGSGSFLREQKTVVYDKKRRHTCVKTCVTFPPSGQTNGLSRSRSPYWYGVYLVVSPGGRRRWVRKSTKKRKRSEAKEILTLGKIPQTGPPLGTWTTLGSEKIVLETVQRVTGKRSDSP
jgi:hypothetical protein